MITNLFSGLFTIVFFAGGLLLQSPAIFRIISRLDLFLDPGVGWKLARPQPFTADTFLVVKAYCFKIY